MSSYTVFSVLLIRQSHIYAPCPVTLSSEVLYTLLQWSIGQFAGFSDLGDFIHVGSKKLHLWAERSRTIRQLTWKLCHQRVDCHQHANCAINMQTVSSTYKLCHEHANCVSNMKTAINMQTVPSTCKLCHQHKWSTCRQPPTCRLCHQHANCHQHVDCHQHTNCAINMQTMSLLPDQRICIKGVFTKHTLISVIVLWALAFIRHLLSEMSLHLIVHSRKHHCVWEVRIMLTSLPYVFAQFANTQLSTRVTDMLGSPAVLSSVHHYMCQLFKLNTRFRIQSFCCCCFNLKKIKFEGTFQICLQLNKKERRKGKKRKGNKTTDFLLAVDDTKIQFLDFRVPSTRKKATANTISC